MTVTNARLDQVRTIVAAVDLSDTSREVLDAACALARKLDARVHVLHIAYDLSKFMGFYVGDKSIASVQTELDREALAKLELLCATCATDSGGEAPPIDSSVRRGTPFSDVTDFVREVSGDLLVVGAHGMSKPEHKIFGSTAERLVRFSPCPVLIVGQK